jgi:hypothetical protein
MVEPVEFADVVRLIAADQQKHWMCGRRHLLEDYLPQHPGLLEAHESLLDIIYNEVRLRNLTGDVATVQEYLHRFPHLSDELEPLFQVHSALESAFPESTYSAAAFAAQPEIPRSINWPQSTRPIAIIDEEFEAHVVQRRARDDGQQRVGIIFYYRDEAPLRRPSDGLRLMRKIPSAGRAVVYQAIDAVNNRVIAVKILLNGPYLSTPAWEELKRQIDVLSGIRHPHLATVFGTAEVEDLPCVCMEFADCGNLSQRLQVGRMSTEAALDLARQMAAGLTELHRRELVHANLKPTNVLRGIDGRWKLSYMSWSAVVPAVLNVGLLVERPQEKKPVRQLMRHLVGGLQPPPHLALFFSEQGWRMGDARYLAPEIMAPDYRGPTAAQDVYALGAILFEVLTGRPPFCGSTPAETLRRAAEQSVADGLKVCGLPPKLEEFCLKCLAKQPQRRPDIEQCTAFLGAPLEDGVCE